MKNKYQGFTLVEMLVVMGILMILMAVGIASGRYAISRANDIAHQDAADEIWDALVGYYTDKRIYPKNKDADCDENNKSVGPASNPFTVTPKDLTTTCLKDYLDSSFDGGSSTTYYYLVSSNRQSAIVCVAKGGVEDESERGFYCTGNGFNDVNLAGGDFTETTIEHDSDHSTLIEKLSNTQDGWSSNWTGSAWE